MYYCHDYLFKISYGFNFNIKGFRLFLTPYCCLDGWVWKDGSPADYFKWEEGEPNGEIGSEECVEMYPWSGTWNDINCYEDKGFICKKRRGELVGFANIAILLVGRECFSFVVFCMFQKII